MNTGNAITIESRALWLMLLHEGGWWTAEALTLLWAPTFAIDEVRALLAGLQRHGFVERREGHARPSWAVTDDCAVLPGVVRQLRAKAEPTLGIPSLVRDSQAAIRRGQTTSKGAAC